MLYKKKKKKSRVDRVTFQETTTGSIRRYVTVRWCRSRFIHRLDLLLSAFLRQGQEDNWDFPIRELRPKGPDLSEHPARFSSRNSAGRRNNVADCKRSFIFRTSDRLQKYHRLSWHWISQQLGLEIKGRCAALLATRLENCTIARLWQAG